MEVPYSSSRFTLSSTAWTDQLLLLACDDLWVDRDKDRNLAPKCLLWQGRTEGQASDSAPHPSASRAVYSILMTWLDVYPEDFRQPLDIACLRLLIGFLQPTVTQVDRKCRVQFLLGPGDQ
jgi:hypothetical protein